MEFLGRILVELLWRQAPNGQADRQTQARHWK